MLAWTKHHAVFERPSYRSPIERAFRSHRGLIPRLYNEFHFREYETGLHRLIEPPVKPEREYILGALVMLDALPLKVQDDPLRTIDRLAAYMVSVHQEMGENLYRQLEVIREGIIR